MGRTSRIPTRLPNGSGATGPVAFEPLPEQLRLLVESDGVDPPDSRVPRPTGISKPAARDGSQLAVDRPAPELPCETMDVTRAARILGISRASGYRYCRLYLDTDGREGIPCIEVCGRILVLVRRFYEWIFDMPAAFTTADPDR